MTSLDAQHDSPESDDLAALQAAQESDAPREPAPFPDAERGQKGYEKRAVDTLLERARQAFEAAVSDDDADVTVTSAMIRDVSFPLVKRGYAIEAVDAALGRLEDAFAARERERGIARHGIDTWVGQARESAQEILDRLARPAGRKFARARGLRFGYRIVEVDLVADKLIGYFERGEKVTVEQVRQAAFRMQRRGYREEQVDALLDAVVEVMLAVE